MNPSPNENMIGENKLNNWPKPYVRLISNCWKYGPYLSQPSEKISYHFALFIYSDFRDFSIFLLWDHPFGLIFEKWSRDAFNDSL